MTARYGGRQPHLAPRARLTAAPEEILARRPLCQAAHQMRPDPDERDGPWLGSAYHSRTPLPIKTALAVGERDLTGLRIGRLRVVGRLDEKATSFGARWVVRCDCGVYFTRRAKALKGRMTLGSSMCQDCAYTIRGRRLAYRDRHGRWPDDDYGLDLLPVDIADLAAARPINLAPPPTPPDPNDKGHKGKGDRAAQRARRRARGLRP